MTVPTPLADRIRAMLIGSDHRQAQRDHLADAVAALELECEKWRSEAARINALERDRDQSRALADNLQRELAELRTDRQHLCSELAELRAHVAAMDERHTGNA